MGNLAKQQNREIRILRAGISMKIGISTASMYPLHTEDALLTAARLGVKNIEIFLNSNTELKGKIFSHIENTIMEYGLNIISVHPFSSPLETLFLFSSYDRRVDEIMDLYKQYFEMMNKINSKIFVVHGAIASGKCPDERYVERFHKLVEAGKSAGIVVAQENVSYCKSGKLEFLEMLSRELGDDAKFVLDIKQARRSGLQPSAIIDALGSKIVHLHLSDGSESALGSQGGSPAANDRGLGAKPPFQEERDCLPIGAGNFDFSGFFAKLDEVGFCGSAVVELYRDNYGDYSELADSVIFLEKMLEKGCN